MAESRINSFAIEVRLFFFSSAYIERVSCNNANLDLPPLDGDLLLSNVHIHAFRLMKRTLSLPPSFRRGNVFHSFPPRLAGRTRACSFSLRAFALTHARVYAHVRVGVHSRLCSCVRPRLRHGGSVACRNVRLKERLARTGSLPFSRRRPPSKEVVSRISATTQSETDNGPRSHRAFKR